METCETFSHLNLLSTPISLFFYLSIFFYFPFSLALNQSIPSTFDLGIKFYNEGNWDLSSKEFQKTLMLEPNNTSVLFNLGLTKYKMGKKGHAVGLWRKVLFIDPTHSQSASALKYVLSKDLPQIPQHHGVIQQFINYVIHLLPLTLLAILSVSIFAYSGWKYLSYLKEKQTTHLHHFKKTNFPIKFVLAFILWSIVSSFIILKEWETTQLKATVIKKELKVKTGPKDDFADIFEIFEGMELQVLQIQGSWAQVFIPGLGKGWISNENLIYTTEVTTW